MKFYGWVVGCIFASLFRKAPLDVQAADRVLKPLERSIMQEFVLLSYGVGPVYQGKVIGFYGDFAASLPLTRAKAEETLLQLKDRMLNVLKQDAFLAEHLDFPIEAAALSLSLTYSGEEGKAHECLFERGNIIR